MRRRLLLFTGTILLAGCGYFNSLYNANRSFAVAERARRTGDRVTAAREYRSAIDRAAVSYRKYPDGRWADDALLLLGRARFALEEYDAAAGAMRTLLAQSADASMRASAHAWLGASLFVLGDPATAAVHLDSAVVALEAGSDDAAFARLWRARTSFDSDRLDAGWNDLAAAVGHQHTARAAALEGIRRGVQVRDSARVLVFMGHLAETRHEGTPVQLDSMLTAIADDWSPAMALRSSAPLALADWPPEVRDAVALSRARLAIAADQPDIAVELAMEVADAVTLGAGSRARHLAAQIRLQRAETLDQLDEVRVLLLPAYDDRRALELMRRIRAAQILITAGGDPASSLSLFAAAELLRDEIGAPLLARRVFLDFAALPQQSIWAGKAALAGHHVAPNAETEAALAQLAGNPYVRVVRGGVYSSDDIDRAEERLAFGIAGLRADAFAEAVRRDVVVGRAITVLDSTRTVARNDSVRIACGVLVDSLGIAGVRADSTRTACLRGDTARVRFVLTADTVLLRDTVGTVDPRVNPARPLPDTTAAPDTTVVPDTVAH